MKQNVVMDNRQCELPLIDMSENIFNSERLVKEFLEFLDVKKISLKVYTSRLKKFFDYVRRNYLTNGVTRHDLMCYRDYLSQNFKPSYVNSNLTVVRLFFQFLENKGLFPNVSLRLKNLTVRNEFLRDALTKEQIIEVLSSIDTMSLEGLRDYLLIELLVTTALRVSELRGVLVKDLANKEGMPGFYAKIKGHDDKDTFVKISPLIDRDIKKYIELAGLRPREYLFVSFSRRHVGQALSIGGRVKKILVACGIDSPKLTAHSLRHSAATLNLLNGGTLEETKDFLNHRSISTTIRYAHHVNKLNNKSCERITNLFYDKNNPFGWFKNKNA